MALSLSPSEISLDRSASQVPRYPLYTQDPRKVYLTRPRNFLLSLDLVHLCCQTIEEVSLSKPPPPHLAANLHGAQRKRTLLFCSAAGAYVCSVVHAHYVSIFAWWVAPTKWSTPKTALFVPGQAGSFLGIPSS